ncbi:lysine-specific demethylase 8 isoform X4 [Brienomyrus brachyistius]|uniref:lysine-specific demethylase 8 isoform X4 n=1 Tax=Brienomyrus brachyistius TaxID=42636 RepID=UPI0020B2E932|nr:lysine-specific demethylase 8 isoform X4 [Brienomyrus brachyistius]
MLQTFILTGAVLSISGTCMLTLRKLCVQSEDVTAALRIMASVWKEIRAALPPTEADFPLHFSEKVERSVVKVLEQARLQLYGTGSTYLLQHTAQTILDFSWERLNIGTWRDVDKEWRRVYAYGCLFKVAALCCAEPGEAEVCEAIRTCDMGLLMGASIMEDVLQTMVVILQRRLRRGCSEQANAAEGPSAKRLKESCVLVPAISPAKEVPRTKCLPLDRFRVDYLTQQKPVILEGAIDHWPAFNDHKWRSPQYLWTSQNPTTPLDFTEAHNTLDFTEAHNTFGLHRTLQHLWTSQKPTIPLDFTKPYNTFGLHRSPQYFWTSQKPTIPLDFTEAHNTFGLHRTLQHLWTSQKPTIPHHSKYILNK